MFRVHTAEVNPTTVKVYKTLSYVFSAVNITAALYVLITFSYALYKITHKDVGPNYDRVNEDDVMDVFTLLKFGAMLIPVKINLIFAALWVFGVLKSRPGLIRAFKIFIIIQLAIFIFALCYSAKWVLENDKEFAAMHVYLIVFIVIFGAEAWVARYYHILLSEEIQRAHTQPATEMM